MNHQKAVWRIIGIVCLWLCAESGAASDRNLTAELDRRIERSRAALSAVQQDIKQASVAIQRQLDAQQNRLRDLRAQAADVRRVKDEQLLSLESLEQRAEQWATQSAYQGHLFENYLNSIEAATFAIIDGQLATPLADLESQMAALPLATARIEAALAPDWSVVDLVSLGGQIRPMDTMKIGPVEIALDPVSGDFGYVERAYAEFPRVRHRVPDSMNPALAQLQADNQGLLYFDPTLGSAFKLRGEASSIENMLAAGGPWLIPILFFGALALLIAVIKSVQLLRLPKIEDGIFARLKVANGGHSTAIAGAVQAAGEAPEASPPRVGKDQQKLIDIACATKVSPERDDLLVAQLKESRFGLERYMGVIATVAAVAPLIGLLGTVSGMISTFKMMTIFGSGDAATVSGGISEALITTELGLIVAIPSLVVSALLSRKVRSYMHKLESFAIRLSKLEVAR